ncbi:MAG: nitroreductase family protein [Bacteroidetes bacterium]|nr:nitroreductase family protein [Bacteroidota bacterium]
MDIKIPQTTGPVMDAITHRWSPRSFAERPIAETDVETILEAATWAFSAANEQPWRYIYAHHGTPLFDTLTGLLMPGNQIWAKNAAVLMVSMIQTHNAAGKPNTWAMHDLGAANFALMLQANALGIYGHVMGGFDQLRTVTELELPEGIAPVAMIALGYLDAAEKLPEPFLTRELAPRTRKPVSEIVLKKS